MAVTLRAPGAASAEEAPVGATAEAAGGGGGGEVRTGAAAALAHGAVAEAPRGLAGAMARRADQRKGVRWGTRRRRKLESAWLESAWLDASRSTKRAIEDRFIIS